jgi:ubiquitin
MPQSKPTTGESPPPSPRASAARSRLAQEKHGDHHSHPAHDDFPANP